ncbi:hypothetical protein BABINDRAFT_67222 [Babjeviella inositovora NRRL Y-12698]|uniref:Prefoldin subunit 6 n=1 Tax=Babjeviella inositovora NRRL Y-12698 TaxID=984486 RepID=A0A1E3QKA6_9ASCO|nr:uncharacterized protein BABINDRAFT_67222 [Babjeviella inositovora NRRL Y-12698]ODQ77512.1 hypothetical protein BABINDRAFT_67222 [Babjeviella inositovora NRRL Y-12698]
MSDKAKFEELSLQFNKLQQDLNDFITSRQKLETQFQENKIVQQEFELLEDGAKIFKLTGPVLLPQDQEEAKMNVEKRIEFIKGEIERVEKKVETTQNDIENTRNEILVLRSKLQPGA